MRKIYLIRHAKPDFQPGQTRCIGSTDVPLGPEGRLQAAALGEYMKTRPVCRVYSSDLSRAVETAREICPDPVTDPRLREMDAGEWEGLTFEEIRRRWPQIYERRGTDPGCPIPGSEPARQGQQRFCAAVADILDRHRGDVAIVAHASVIQSFLSFVYGTDVALSRQYRLDYTGVCTVAFDASGYRVLSCNEIPGQSPGTRMLLGKGAGQ